MLILWPMDTQSTHKTSHDTLVGNITPNAQPAPKWLSTVNDLNVHVPTRRVSVQLLKHQANVPDTHVLVRDLGSEHDEAFADDSVIDLADGNVFFTVPRCNYRPKGKGSAPAKRAFFVDDRPAITLRADQTGHTLRELFGMPDSVALFRDYQSPNDEPIGPSMPVRFMDGPAFYSRPDKCEQPREIKIIVNGREKTVTEKKLSYAQIVRLAFNPADADTIYTVTYKKGPPSNPQGSMVEGDIVNLECGMIFNVTATRKS